MLRLKRIHSLEGIKHITFDPKAEGSLSEARGDIIISHYSIIINSSSVAFDFTIKVQTSYCDEHGLDTKDFSAKTSVPFTVEGIELDLRMRGFEFFSLVSDYLSDSPKLMHLKATGRVKFQGKVLKSCSTIEQDLSLENNMQQVKSNEEKTDCLASEVLISGLQLNHLMLGPQLNRLLSISRDFFKVA